MEGETVKRTRSRFGKHPARRKFPSSVVREPDVPVPSLLLKHALRQRLTIRGSETDVSRILCSASPVEKLRQFRKVVALAKMSSLYIGHLGQLRGL